ncbi:hypothetical protein K525DRAFT_187568 [Schizophyllum commune Loenen D]|nr:hypothetical protein K525DRAFT_187568 [Schizophyllum commune Loenen D]
MTADESACRQDFLRDVHTLVRATLPSMKRGVYLGHTNAKDHIVWQEASPMDFVALKVASGRAGALRPVPLVAIGLLDPATFNFKPDGGYKGPTGEYPTLEDVELRAELRPSNHPDHARFLQESTDACRAVHDMMDAAPEAHDTFQCGCYGGGISIRLRHQLFQTLPRTNGDGSIIPEPEPRPGYEQFMTTAWPMSHEAADDELQFETSTTNNIVPLPAYDVMGRLLGPAEYEDALSGAFVEVLFTVKHRRFRTRDDFSTFNIDVVQINVLDPPPHTRSRKLPALRQSPTLRERLAARV